MEEEKSMPLVLDWGFVAMAALKWGWPAAEYVVKMWHEKRAVTPDLVAEARRLGTLTPESLFSDVLTAGGISQDDPAAAAIFALLKKP